MTRPKQAPSVHYARYLPRSKRTVALCATIEGLTLTTDPRAITCRRCLARLEHGARFTRVTP